MKIFTFIPNFLIFCVKPSFYREHASVATKVFNSLILLIFNLLIATIVIFLSLHFFNFKNSPSFTPIPYSTNSLLFLLAILLIGPLVEELTFRLPLIYSKLNICIFLSLLFSIIFKCFYQLDFPQTFPGSKTILGGLIIFPFLYLIFFSSQKVSNFVQLFYKKWNVFIFYVFVFAFAIFHLTNFKSLTIASLPLAFFTATTDKLVGGFTLSFLRIKYGIIYSIIFHCLHNFCGLYFMKYLIFYFA
jgi:hypothetical protein